MLLLLLALTSSSSVYADDQIFTLPMISEGLVTSNQTFFEMEEDHERLCGVEGRLLKEKGDQLVQCKSDDECLPPSQCHTTGYCCMVALNQEPPPVGCPIGTRPLVNSSGMELTCSPSVPDSCPGGALCYTDSLTNAKRCCGTDPGQGCPSGSRALLTVLEKPMLCTPGKADALCPRGALCQWSHLIDRYQCCEPDNGCPRHQAPLKTPFGTPLICNPKGPPCPEGGGCHFNFWTASHQCCKMDTADLCPAGQVPFLTQSNGDPKSCKKNLDCPSSYHCADNNICCGSPGQCPVDHQPSQDKFGRITACTSRNGNTCPVGSQCMATSTFSQQVCCEKIEYTCPGYSTPYPSPRFPQKCNIAEPWQCGANQCMPSNIPSVNICCQSTVVRQRTINPCPAGWSVIDNTITYCTPSYHTSSCPGFSSCLRSATVQQQFICCAPTMAAVRDSCVDPKGTVELVGGAQRKCVPNTNSCSSGFSCQPSKRSGWLCCSVVRQAQAQFTCPLLGQQPVFTPQGGNQFCSAAGQSADCPRNSLCVSAGNSANLFICCSAAAAQVNPICPNNGVPQPSPNGYRTCSLTSLNDCDSGYSCVRAANDFSIQLCCSANNPQLPVCPNQGILLTERGRPVYCSASQPQLCPSNYVCQAAVGSPGTYVCCSSGSSSSLTCPARYLPSLDPNGNQIFCSPTSSVDCPGGSSCLQSTQTAAVYLCCRDDSSSRVCPNNQNAFITPGGTVETCNAPGASCSHAGYTCQLSTPLAQYVCCGNDPSPAYCADGRSTYEQIAGQTYACNPLQFPPSCPVGYQCAQSTVAGTSVCCAIGFGPVPTLAPSEDQCPAGWSSYRNDVNLRPRNCSGPFDMGCPIGFSCAPSLVAGQFLCCRMSTSMRCTRGQTFLANNHPRLCNRNRLNQCPRGYSCEQSTNPTITICCGAAVPEQPMCPNGRPPAMLNGFIRSCPVEGQTGGCPNGNTCQRATNDLLVCCPSSISRHSGKQNSLSFCPDNRQPVFSQLTNDIVYCDVTAFMCADGKECLPELHTDRFICCSSIPKCRYGAAELDFSGKVKRCDAVNECSHGFLCSASDVRDVQVCCSSGATPVGDFSASPSNANIANINEEEWVVIEG